MLHTGSFVASIFRTTSNVAELFGPTTTFDGVITFTAPLACVVGCSGTCC